MRLCTGPAMRRPSRWKVVSRVRSSPSGQLFSIEMKAMRLPSRCSRSASSAVSARPIRSAILADHPPDRRGPDQRGVARGGIARRASARPAAV